jgi:hypothetical protein
VAQATGKGQQNIIAVCGNEVWGTLKRGVRKSKYDLKVNLNFGDIVLVAVPENGMPAIFKLPGGLESLDYHPGNILVPALHHLHQTDEVVYQNSLFKIYSNPKIMEENLDGMIRSGASLVSHIPLMERIVIRRAYAGRFSDVDELAWDKYQKLKARFAHPTTPAPEAAVSAKLAAKYLVKIVMPNWKGEVK